MISQTNHLLGRSDPNDLLYATVLKYGDKLIEDQADRKEFAAAAFDSRLVILDPNLLNFSMGQDHLPLDIDMPLKKMFIECYGPQGLFIVQYATGASTVLAILAEEQPDGGSKIACVLQDIYQRTAVYFMGPQAVPKDAVDQSLFFGIKKVFSAINSKTTVCGEVAVNHKFERHGLPPHRVRRIVVFKDKNKKSESPEEIMGREVDWKHTWEVMGHWRKVAFVGKDRDGNYWVKGKTWVRPCVRGQGNLIVKTRLMKKHQGSVKA